ncbi:MAG: glutaredoxin 3 [Xanthomonadales bacterium]|nr:glutaredoxin 3 [Xanthomonadales bacterium]
MSVVTIYSTAICPYCVAAKNFLSNRGVAWEEVRIDLDPVRRQEMLDKARRTSVPQIFVGDVHIGGYDDLVALARDGGLDELLQGSSSAD